MVRWRAGPGRGPPGPLLLLMITSISLVPSIFAIRCQCSTSKSGISCNQQLNWCEVNKLNEKVGACAVVRSGSQQHFACVRVKESSGDTCKVDTNEDGSTTTRCWCKSHDYCNLDLLEELDKLPQSRENELLEEDSPETESEPPFQIEKSYDSSEDSNTAPSNREVQGKQHPKGRAPHLNSLLHTSNSFEDAGTQGKREDEILWEREEAEIRRKLLAERLEQQRERLERQRQQEEERQRKNEEERRRQDEERRRTEMRRREEERRHREHVEEERRRKEEEEEMRRRQFEVEEEERKEREMEGKQGNDGDEDEQEIEEQMNWQHKEEEKMEEEQKLAEEREREKEERRKMEKEEMERQKRREYERKLREERLRKEKEEREKLEKQQKEMEERRRREEEEKGRREEEERKRKEEEEREKMREKESEQQQRHHLPASPVRPLLMSYNEQSAHQIDSVVVAPKSRQQSSNRRRPLDVSSLMNQNRKDPSTSAPLPTIPAPREGLGIMKIQSFISQESPIETTMTSTTVTTTTTASTTRRITTTTTQKLTTQVLREEKRAETEAPNWKEKYARDKTTENEKSGLKNELSESQEESNPFVEPRRAGASPDSAKSRRFLIGVTFLLFSLFLRQ